MKRKIMLNREVQDKMRNYTHQDLAERLCHAITDSGYDLDELDQSEFDDILDHFISKKEPTQ